ncbi:MAG: hypothetical protein V1809_12085 [Planctomycetota bacterium]
MSLMLILALVVLLGSILILFQEEAEAFGKYCAFAGVVAATLEIAILQKFFTFGDGVLTVLIGITFLGACLATLRVQAKFGLLLAMTASLLQLLAVFHIIITVR